MGVNCISLFIKGNSFSNNLLGLLVERSRGALGEAGLIFGEPEGPGMGCVVGVGVLEVGLVLLDGIFLTAQPWAVFLNLIGLLTRSLSFLRLKKKELEIITN